MAGDIPALTRCATCRFWQRHNVEGICRRNAPRTIDRPYIAARWPETRAIDGCGEGEPEPATNPDRTVAHFTCLDCVFWDRPGLGIEPTYRDDHQAAWWRAAGFCRRRAPLPGADVGTHGFWRATHATDYCFEGAPRPP